MILLRCSQSQSRRKQARGNGRTVHGNAISVQCSACQSGEKFKTNAGKRLCCAVLLCCAVECCVVLLWCVCVWCRVTFFCSFSREKRITFQDVRFSKPLTFHNDFMFFCFSQCSKHFSRLQAYLFHISGRACCLEKCLKQLREEKKHEIIVEGQRLRKRTSWKVMRFSRENEQKSCGVSWRY